MLILNNEIIEFLKQFENYYIISENDGIKLYNVVIHSDIDDFKGFRFKPLSELNGDIRNYRLLLNDAQDFTTSSELIEIFDFSDFENCSHSVIMEELVDTFDKLNIYKQYKLKHF